MMKTNIIKTYSRKQPLTFFNPTTALVAKYTDPDNNVKVRESRLNDKTLIVDDLNDTFDKIATGVIISSAKIDPNYNDSYDKSDQNGEDIFKIPSKLLKKRRRPREKEQEKLTSDKIYNIKKKKNKMKKTEKKNKERHELKDKENYSLKKCTIALKRCDIETNRKKCEIHIPNISQDENSIDVKSCNSKNLVKNFQESNEISKKIALKITNDFPTSTPREYKLRKIVDMQNISPIVLLQENENENEEHKDLSSEVILNNESNIEVFCKESNINSDKNVLSKESEFVKSESKIEVIKEHISKDLELKNNFKNTLNDSEIEVLKLSSKNDLVDTINTQHSYESNNVLKQNSASQLNINNKHATQTPIANKEIIYNIECGDSPLLFEDTEENLNTEVNILRSCSRSLIENLSKNRLALEIVNDNSRNLETSKNDSSFYPHDWSNEYDSSYEYFTGKKNVTEKELDVKDSKNLENISEKSDFVEVIISQNNSSILSTDNSLEKINADEDIECNKEFSSNNFSSTKRNSIESSDEVNNIENTDFNKDNITDGVENNMQAMITSEKNISNSQEISSNLNQLDEMNVSLNILENNEIERQNQILLETTEVDLFDTQNENNLNSNDQTDKSIKDHDLETSEQKENIQNTEKDKKINNKELQINLFKIDDQKVEKRSSQSKVLKRKRNSESESNRDKVKVFKAQYDEIDFAKQRTNMFDTPTIEGIEHIDKINTGLEMVTKYSKLDFEKNSPILLEKIVKNKIGTNSQLDISKAENKHVADNDSNSDTSTSENENISLKLDEINIEDNSAFEKNNPNKFENQPKEVNIITSTKSPAFSKIRFNLPHKNFKNKTTLRRDTVSKNKIKKNTIEKIKLKKLCVVLTKIDDQNTDKRSSILLRKNTKENSEIIKLGKPNEPTYIKDKENDIKIKENNINSAESQKDNSELGKNFSKNISQSQNINFETHEEIHKTINSENLHSYLSKLNSVAVTMRRNVHKRSDKPLAVIAEHEIDQLPNITNKKEESTEKLNDFKMNHCNTDGKSEEDNHNKSIKNNPKYYPIFLKPGKFWTRSLSIINNFHNGQNLEELAVGRGQNWRHSVQSILNMQVEGIVKSNSRQTNNINNLVDNLDQRKSHKISTATNSPPRISRRFSIRIIPSDTRLTLTDDFIQSERSSSINISNKTRKTSVSRKTSLKIQRDTVIESEEDLIKSAETIILKHCKQTSYLPFDACFSNSYIDHCRKIGEGVYGEVFLYENKTEKSVLKIIPIEGDELVNCEPQKKFHEILSEIIISEELHKLKSEDKYKTSGFVDIIRIMCVIGKYPNKLIDLWKKYDQEKKSENDCPSMFNDQQLYIILELAHGGQDLEAYTFQNASESLSIFLQTAYSLAVAEQSLEFEHRDLHWGNILISKTEDTNSFYRLDNEEIMLSTKGVKVSIIDFTLSRMSYQGCKIFNDLAADPTLFTAQGEYQFDIYRMMKTSVNNNWQQFNPVTNIFWLDYTLDKMITGARYKRKTTKIHKTAIEQMKQLRKEILHFKSAFDFVKNCNIFIAIVNSYKKCT